MSCSLCDPRKKSMTSLVIWQGFLLLYVLTRHCSTFNLDERYPRVISSPKPNTYFGYSVAFWIGETGYKVLVGSPKAISGMLVTGGLFQCVIEDGFCELMETDNGSRSHNSRANQWLGVSLDVSPIDERVITVCAHRAKFDFYRQMINGREAVTVMNGICYHLENDRTTSVIKFHDSQQSYNLLGMSLQYAKRSSMLIIGMPGKNRYRGGFYKKLFSGHDVENIDVHRYNYSGYCVAVLNNKPVIGIPRYEQYGAVSYQDQILTIKSKYAFGSYFGSSLAAADLNNDENEDLIVGAPYYSEKSVEEGRVYIFFFSSSTLKIEDTPKIILSVPSYRGQFGKTLATGDFNKDGNPDVIVAAPYENDGSGTIYIFSGHRSGLHKTFSQKIQGKDLQQDIQSFGISFSRTVDIDSNGYQDIAVGAYLSDKVFVLYGRPIVKINGSLKAEPRILTSWINNTNVSTLLQVDMNLETMDPMSFIIHFNTDTNRNPARTYILNDQKEFIDTVEIQKSFRKTFLVTIKNTVDILEPLNFTFTYYLKDQGYSPVCRNTCPIAKNGSFSTQVKFDIGCGKDDTCNTYLKVSIKKNRRRLILGRNKRFVLLAEVENVGENAYSAKASIFHSKFLEFESVNQTSDSNVQCHQEKSQELSCFLGHPLKEKSSVSFEVVFFIDSTTKEDSIHVVMNATTISKVPVNLVDNTQSLSALMYYDSKLEVTGFSVPDSEVFKDSNKKVMSLMHQYELRNDGPSDAPAVTFFVLIPQAFFQNIPLIFNLTHKVKRDDKIFNNVCHVMPFTENHTATFQQLQHNGHTFNCTGFKCLNMSCELGQIKKNEPVIKIQVYFGIHISLLKFFQGRIRRIYIDTSATLTQPHSYRLKAVRSDHAMATTTIIIKRIPAKLKWWVVICSLAVGVLILLIFSIFLWHCGYFKRVRVNKRQMREEQAKEERSLLEHDSGRRPSQKIYTRQKISESEEVPEID